MAIVIKKRLMKNCLWVLIIVNKFDVFHFCHSGFDTRSSNFHKNGWILDQAWNDGAVIVSSF